MVHHDPSRRPRQGRRGHRSRPAAHFWLLACVVAVIAAPVAARDARAAASPPAVEQVCRSVTQLSPGSVHFDNCTTSLARTAEAQAESARLQAAWRQCLDRGLDRGTPALSTCALQALDTAPAEARSARRSWIGASFDERLRRIRLACAQMGLDPMGAAFDACVLDLQPTLSSADRSQ
jgi:hypothetical protein